MRSDFTGPVNIGSEEMVTINQLAAMVMDIAGKRLSIRHVPRPLGVRPQLGQPADSREAGLGAAQVLKSGQSKRIHGFRGK